MRSLICTAVCLFLIGCTWQESNRPSFLLIAVEGLSAEDIACAPSGQAGAEGERDEQSGFALLCSESVRFTHAFTTTTMSQGALASVFTGEYPAQHRVWHNGEVFLSESATTLAEVALPSGYRTGFFSGGPGIWHKSGLGQGFEHFDDNLPLRLSGLFRPIEGVTRLASQWLADIGRNPFFMQLYLADLQFPNSPTETSTGDERELGPKGQIEEIDETLGAFFAELKRSGRWDNTHVFLFGLNGRPQMNRNEVEMLDLQSDNTQVALFVKPARKARDEGVQWTIDANVNLADLGATIFEILTGKPRESSDVPSEKFEAISFRSALDRPAVDWDRDRKFVVESAWASWRGIGGSRFAVRQGAMLYIHDKTPKIYNTLVDRLEVQPIPASDPTIKQWASEVSRFLANHKMPAWDDVDDEVVTKVRLAGDLWRDGVVTEDELVRLGHLYKKRAWDKQIAGWLAETHSREGRWSELLVLGQEADEPLWQYVAKKNLNIPAEPVDDVCLRSVLGRDVPPSKCRDAELRALAEWIKSKGDDRPSAEERFVRIYLERELDKRISAQNFVSGLRWDTSMEAWSGPRLTDLVVALPEYKSYRDQIRRRLLRAGAN